MSKQAFFLSFGKSGNNYNPYQVLLLSRAQMERLVPTSDLVNNFATLELRDNLCEGHSNKM